MRYFTYMDKSTLDVLDTTLMFATFSNSENVAGSTREPMWGERTYYRPVANEFGYTYSEVLQYTYSLIKCNGYDFTDEEQRIIERWLTSPRLSRWLIVKDTEDDTYETRYFGAFINTEWVVGADGFMGVTFTFQNNAPYPWKTETHTINAYNGNSFSFTCNSDDLESPVYPKIRMICDENANITVTNITDNYRYFNINMLRRLPVVMDCEHNIIKDGTSGGVISYADLGWQDVSSIYWPVIYAGQNTWMISGADVTFEIEYNVPFKRVGGWM